MVPVTPFPIDVFPDPVRRLINEGATSFGCHHDFFVPPILAVAGSAFGRTACLKMKDGYFESGVFYGAFVGDPGTAKSAVVSLVSEPLRRIDEEEGERFKKAKPEGS